MGEMEPENVLWDGERRKGETPKVQLTCLKAGHNSPKTETFVTGVMSIKA